MPRKTSISSSVHFASRLRNDNSCDAFAISFISGVFITTCIQVGETQLQQKISGSESRIIAR